jgi:hypothetical protein
MHKLVKYVGVSLLVMGLAACDNKDGNTEAVDSSAVSATAAQTVTLLDGKVSFSLPTDISDQSGKVGTQSNNMHVYSDASGQKAVIVIISEESTDTLSTLADRLEQQQRARDPQLQVVSNKPVEIKGHTLQQLDTIISAQGQTTYSSIVLGKVGNQLLTMQVSLPADNQAQAQASAESILSTLTIN